MLIDSPIEIDPAAGDLEVGLVDEPPVSHRMAAGPRGVDELWRECLHPPINRDVIHLDAALGLWAYSVADVRH